MTTTNFVPQQTMVMPSLGENVTEATVTRWLKQPGEEVEIGDPLLEVATDKVDTEIPSPVAGTMIEILYAENDVVPVGAPLAVIDNKRHASGPHLPPGHAPEEPTPEPTVTVRSSAAQEAPSEAVVSAIFVKTESPNALSAESATSSTIESSDSRVQKLSRTRRVIAARMVESLQTSAQLTTVVEVDISRIAHLREENKTAFLLRTGRKLSFMPFLVKAALHALGANPVINASLNELVTEATYHRACHLGIAVESPKGLMVPVIRHADRLSIAGLAEAIASMAEKVRNGRIAPDDLVGGTYTITNTGSRGALFDTPIINQPQSAILGAGAVVERLVPRRDNSGNLQIRVAHMLYLSLSYDHRIIDGADAARYLTDVRTILEHGYSSSELH